MALSGDWKTWRHYHKQGHVRDAITAYGGTQRHTGTDCAICAGVFTRLLPQIGVRPMTFANKVNGVWINVPPVEAERRLGNYAREIHAYMTGTDKDGVDLTPAPEPQAEPVPVPVPVPSSADEYAKLDEILASMRDFCQTRGIEGNFVQSARSDFNGYRMLGQGIPAVAIASAVATTWSDATRDQFTAAHGTPLSYDPCTFGQAIVGLHRVTPYLIAAIKANVPVYLHGPTGTLKSSGIKRAASEMGLPYYETNLAGQLASAITGRDLLQRFAESSYVKAYRDGGIWTGEEIDKTHPLVLTQINNSMESDEYHNPMMDAPIKRNPNFRIVVNANTPGTGPTKEFNASMKLDDSTLDRFRTGYIRVSRDHTVVRNVLDQIKAAQLAA